MHSIVSRIMLRLKPFSIVLSKQTQYFEIHQVKYNILYTTSIPLLFSTDVTAADVVDYDYVKKAACNTAVLIVDVREPAEIQEHGKIPNSVNIPLDKVAVVLKMSNREFQQAFNMQRPSSDTEIIFYCKSGKRAGKAQKCAINLGYKKVKNYVGSWTDWATREKW